jgi:SNF2 family DNA or RNA helicase
MIELEIGKTYFSQISSGFAGFNKIPVYFEGTVLKETPKAVYVFGTKPTESTVLLDQWLPKAVFISAEEINRKIEIPADHKMYTNSAPVKPERKAILKDKTIIITFPYNTEDVGRIKTLTGRRFSKDGGAHWTAPFSKETVELLKEWKFALNETLETEYQSRFGTTMKVVNEIEIPGLIGPGLFPFQKQGVAFLERRNGNAIIGDEMGLGKSCQSLAWLQLHPEFKKNIVIAPASLLLNWKKEVKMWLNEIAIVANGDFTIRKKKYHEFKNTDTRILIISYDTYVKDKEYINAL